MEDLTGFLESIVFSSEDTVFTVARLKSLRFHDLVTIEDTVFTVARLKSLRFHDLVTIEGTLPEVQPGERLSCRGTWKHHSQYGRQFEIEKYLASGLIKGIGPIYAKRIAILSEKKRTMPSIFGLVPFMLLKKES